MRRFSLIALLLAALMIVSLAACTTTTPSVSPSAAVATPAASPATDGTTVVEPEAKTYETKLTISQNVLDAEKSGKTAKNEWFNKKFNVEFEYIPVTWGDWNEKVRAWVAADDAPDLLWWDMKGGTSNEYRAWASQGAFRALPDDMAAWPELQANREKMQSAKVMEVDGKLFAWPSSRNNDPITQDIYYSMFMYRQDWAKAVGLYKEGDVYTWDEMYALAKAVIEQDPGKNGKGQTLGITTTAWGFASAAFMDTQNITSGYQKDETGAYIWGATLPAYKENLKRAVKLFQDGVIWKDQMLVQGNEGPDKFKAGQAFMVFDSNGNFNYDTRRDDMMKDGFITDPQAIQPMYVLASDGNFYLTQTEDFWTVTAFNHNIDDEKMNRILDYWNWSITDEGRNFRWVGIEGVDYTKTGDTVEILWAKDADGNWISPYKDTAMNELSPGGGTGGPNPADRKDGWETIDKVMEMMTKPNFRIHPFDYEVNFMSGTNKDKYGSFGTDTNNKIKEIMATTGVDVDAAWDAYVAEQMPKVTLVLEEINSQIAAK